MPYDSLLPPPGRPGRYENTERRQKKALEKGLLYLGMGVSGGEEGARRGPSMMPGGSKEAYGHIEPIVSKVSAQVRDGRAVMLRTCPW